jgi:hypothetical protein
VTQQILPTCPVDSITEWCPPPTQGVTIMTESMPFSQPARAEDPPLLRFLRGFLETNYCYVISAGLMILGCYLLMRGAPVAGGEITRILTGVLVLQGYELLVLGTIMLIRRRLPTIEDTLTLVGVETILLFDPSFFANTFHTLVQSDRANGVGPWITAGCLALVPIKVWVIARMNGFTLAGSTWGFLLLAAAIVYLMPGLMATTDPALGRTGTMFALCWLTMICLVIPPVADRVISAGRDRIRSPLHHRWVPRFFLHFPAILLFAHLGNTWWVHLVNFQAALVAPLILAVGVRALLRNKHWAIDSRVLTMDAFTLAALVAALPAIGVSPKEVYNRPELFFAGIGPVALVGMVASVVYAVGGMRLALPTLFIRPAIIALAGLGWLAYTKGLFDLLLQNWLWVEIAVWSILFVLTAWRRWHGFLPWLCIWVVPIGARLPGIGFVSHLPEILQALYLVIYLQIHLMERGRGNPESQGLELEQLFFFLIGLMAVLRAIISPLEWSIPWAFLLAGTAIGLAVIYRVPALAKIGGAQATILAVWLLRGWILGLGASVLVIAASLIIFAVGVLISFRKERWLQALDPDNAPVSSDPLAQGGETP